MLATAGMTYGRIPDGTGDWTWTLPTPGTSNAVAPDTQGDDPAWLYDPLQVTEIDLEASPAALAQLAAVPDEYVEARITLRNGASTYGPYVVGLRLKGHAAFRTLDGKAAFKVKFGYAVSGQRFFGLKGLTLNNMVQDPSMIAEATSSLLVAATGAPAARVGYAYVRLNGADYGLYANVETIDAVMARRWFTGTQHIYEANLDGVDASPGRAGEFEVDEGSSTDRSDLEALAAANAGGADGWWERMQPVADLAEMTRAWAAEHYIGPLGRLLGRGGPDPAQQLLPAQRPRGPLLPHRLRHRPDVAGASGVRGLRQRGADARLRRGCHLPAALHRCAAPDRRQPGNRRAPGAGARDSRRDRALACARSAARADGRRGRGAGRCQDRDHGRPPGGAGRMARGPVVRRCRGCRRRPEAAALPCRLRRPSAPTRPPTPLSPVMPQTRLDAAAGGAAAAREGRRGAREAGGREAVHVLAAGDPERHGRAAADRQDGLRPVGGGKVLRHTDSFKAGKARLSFVVPKTAKGKLLKVEIKITASGQTASRTYTYAVR